MTKTKTMMKMTKTKMTKTKMTEMKMTKMKTMVMMMKTKMETTMRMARVTRKVKTELTLIPTWNQTSRTWIRTWDQTLRTWIRTWDQTLRTWIRTWRLIRSYMQELSRLKRALSNTSSERATSALRTSHFGAESPDTHTPLIPFIAPSWYLHSFCHLFTVNHRFLPELLLYAKKTIHILRLLFYVPFAQCMTVCNCHFVH
ncbi:hypothetical protein BKA70DRAFT_1292208 [Coprinopsis sp. MPI-PUGE-AT-0042]|nr:hypothetical protein BKA70DRAFT_1292208 [Coprinopsis sp. MPI-PUGE-AT-0042]